MSVVINGGVCYGEKLAEREKSACVGVVGVVEETCLLRGINQISARRARAMWVCGRRVFREEVAADSKAPRCFNISGYIHEASMAGEE